MAQRFLAAVLLCLCLGLAAATQAAGLALVIGNGSYPMRPLANTANDARDVAATLREAGFEVMLKLDLGEAQMKEALADFEDRLRITRGVGLFYFAGHGMQTSRGRNYLLPVGRSYLRERDVELFGVGADAVLASMEKVGNSLNIVILDACRDAPLPADQRSAGSRGLARMDAPSGSVIAFATAPGRTASDNSGQRNGLYTQHLLRAMRLPGLRIEDVFKEVGRAVELASGGLQSPEEFMKLRDPAPFCFFPGRGCGGAGQPATRVQSAEELEQEYWETIRGSRDLRDFRDYLQRYPNGRFVMLANRQLRLLEPAPQPTTQTPPGGTGAESGSAGGGGTQVAVAPPRVTASPGPVMEKVTFAADVFFSHAAPTLPASAAAKLDDLAQRLQAINLEVVIAVGHASASEGPQDRALALSMSRADAVKSYLVGKGVGANRIYVEGKGSRQPVADEQSADGRAKNRRVELEAVGTRVKS